MKIYDCFTFNNELDLLEFRFNCMYDYVDKFVLVESRKNFRNDTPQPLHYNENKDRFKRFSDKIIHIIVDDDDFIEGSAAWDKVKHFYMKPRAGRTHGVYPNTQIIEIIQRDAISQGLVDVEDDDIIIISDIDEIVKSNVLKELRNCTEDFFYFNMLFSNFKFNYICVKGEVHTVWSVAYRGKDVNKFTPNDARLNRLYMRANDFQPNSKMFNFAGWHFSFLGDNEFIKKKIIDAAYDIDPTQELIKTLNTVDIDKLINDSSGGKDILNRDSTWMAIELDHEIFPEYLINNKKKYSKYLIKNPKHKLQIS